MTSTSLADSWAIVLHNLHMSVGLKSSFSPGTAQGSLFFNGICIMLVVQACYFLVSRVVFPGRNILICTTIAACALAMAQVINQVVFTATFLRLLQSAEVGETLIAQEEILSSIQHLEIVKDVWDTILLIITKCVISNLVRRAETDTQGSATADGLLVCVKFSYDLWAKLSTRFIAATGSGEAFGTATLAFALTESALDPVAVFFRRNAFVGNLVGMVATNTLLTGLSAGRIWWTRHHLRNFGGTRFVHSLESSALYLIIVLTVILSLIIGGFTVFDSPAISVLRGASLQLMDIIPALIIVRANLARCVDTDPERLGLKAPLADGEQALFYFPRIPTVEFSVDLDLSSLGPNLDARAELREFG
ncbi:hypothetical protein C8R47DRAFT_1083712 [Mycena vitilis]|nr:hypothetical protein C8R47DRAFT_1083712 [Mycena vitilis]